MLDGVLRYGIAGLRHDGTWAVALHEVGALVQTGARSRARPATPPSRALVALSGLTSAPIAAPVIQRRRRAFREGSATVIETRATTKQMHFTPGIPLSATVTASYRF